MGYGMKDWQVEYKGMPIGTLGDLQFLDAIPDESRLGGMFEDKFMTFECSFKGSSFKKIAKKLGLKPAWLEYAHEWSAKCRALRRKLKDRWKR